MSCQHFSRKKELVLIPLPLPDNNSLQFGAISFFKSKQQLCFTDLNQLVAVRNVDINTPDPYVQTNGPTNCNMFALDCRFNISHRTCVPS